MRRLLLFFLKSSELGSVMYCLIIGYHYFISYITCISPAFPFDAHRGMCSVIKKAIGDDKGLNLAVPNSTTPKCYSRSLIPRTHDRPCAGTD